MSKPLLEIWSTYQLKHWFSLLIDSIHQSEIRCYESSFFFIGLVACCFGRIKRRRMLEFVLYAYFFLVFTNNIYHKIFLYYKKPTTLINIPSYEYIFHSNSEVYFVKKLNFISHMRIYSRFLLILTIQSNNGSEFLCKK
jgi:hypothetical protein